MSKKLFEGLEFCEFYIYNVLALKFAVKCYSKSLFIRKFNVDGIYVNLRAPWVIFS